MTEIGMGLSNSLHGKRVPGAVGTPLPGVEARLVDDTGMPVALGTPGEIEFRGKLVFSEYWRRPEDTQKAFRNGWFMSGDIAVIENGIYRILGRNSVDIIKTGGEKVSALEIEETLLTHPDVKECAVVGVPDPVWGEKVCAALLLKHGKAMDIETLRAWGKERLAPYKVPKDLAVLEKLPRNAMGKIIKPDVKKMFSG
jgi:malonyl-CoA/methylmalonyl-CoA synthetase